MSVYGKLMAIQKKLVVKKGRYNGGGEFSYRSCEDILAELKPICEENGCVVTLTDTVKVVGDRYYVESTAVLTEIESGENVHSSALARESQAIAGMDTSQITGAASSYARKYALCGLFAIDGGVKDADALPPPEKTVAEVIDQAPIEVSSMEEAFAVRVTAGMSIGRTLKEVYDSGMIKTLFWVVNNDKVASPAARYIVMHDETLRSMCTVKKTE